MWGWRESYSIASAFLYSLEGGGLSRRTLLNVTCEENFPAEEKISFVLCIMRRLSAKEEKIEENQIKKFSTFDFNL